MKNTSFVRLWAPLIAALVFAVAFLATHFALNPREKAKSVGELNALIDMAETRAAAEQANAPDLGDDVDAAAIHKARTVERFLSHDDTLLQTDALLVLCDLIGMDSVAVADSEGSVIAASDAGMIGQTLSADTDLAWCMALLDEGAAPTAVENGPDGRIAGVPRSDIDGLILVWSRSPALNAAGGSGIRAAAENLAIAPDALKLVETAGEDGVFEQDGMLYVQRAEGEITLIASRPLSEVYAVQNAVLTALAVFAAVSLIALFVWQLAGRRDGTPAPEDEAFDQELEPPSAPTSESESESEPEVEAPKRKRRRRPLIEITEDTEEEELQLTPELPPRKRKKGPRSVARGSRGDEEANRDTDFDKIFE